MEIELREPYNQTEIVQTLRTDCANDLWNITDIFNLLNRTAWQGETNKVLKKYQDEIILQIKSGYSGKEPIEIWSYPAALMFALSVITMVGYGNNVPRSAWGKGATVIYATFGIPLYILYFLNVGKVLAKTFKFLYTWVHECTRDRSEDEFNYLENGEKQPNKKVIVPSTACLWVMFLYIATGTIMFAEWEQWKYLDSLYFCVTSLCKIGIGDFVPGANILDTESGKQTKLTINFVYILLGMGLVAMCYNLMREEVKVKMQEIKEDMRLCLEDLRVRFAKCCSGGNKDEYYM